MATEEVNIIMIEPVAMEQDDTVEEELDSHACLWCSLHIQGLENYVHHKRYECPARNMKSTKTRLMSAKQEPESQSNCAEDETDNDGHSGTLAVTEMKDSSDTVEQPKLKKKHSTPDNMDEAILETASKLNRAKSVIKDVILQPKQELDSDSSSHLKTELIHNITESTETDKSRSVSRPRGRPRKHPLNQPASTPKTDKNTPDHTVQHKSKETGLSSDIKSGISNHNVPCKSEQFVHNVTRHSSRGNVVNDESYNIDQHSSTSSDEVMEETPVPRRVGRPPKMKKMPKILLKESESPSAKRNGQLLGETSESETKAVDESPVESRRLGRPRKRTRSTRLIEEGYECDSITTSGKPDRPGKHQRLESDERTQTAESSKPSEGHDDSSKTPKASRRVGRPPKKLCPEPAEFIPTKLSEASESKENLPNIPTSPNSPRRVGRPPKIKQATTGDTPKRTERYEGSDLYKPRVSYGGSRHRSRADRVSTDHSTVVPSQKRDVTPSKPLAKTISTSEKKKKHESKNIPKETVIKTAAEKTKIENRNKNTDAKSKKHEPEKSMKQATELFKTSKSDTLATAKSFPVITFKKKYKKLSEAVDSTEDREKIVKDNEEDLESVLETVPLILPPPVPVVMDTISGLKLACVDSVGGLPVVDSSRSTEGISGGLLLVNLLNDLYLDGHLRGLTHLPAISHPDQTESTTMDKAVISGSLSSADVSAISITQDSSQVFDTEEHLEKSWTGQQPEDKSATEQVTEESVTEQYAVHKSVAEQHSMEESVTEQNSVEKSVTEKHSVEKSVTEQHSVDESVTELHPDERSATEKQSKYNLLPKCSECALSFVNSLAYHSHLQSPEHQLQGSSPLDDQKTNAEPRLPVTVSNNPTCPSCMITCGERYTFAHHLILALNLSESSANSDPELCQLMQALNPYHCRLCVHYGESQEEFLEHLGSEEHNKTVDKLAGVMLCATCDFRSRSKKEIYLHFKDSHIDRELFTVPCILDEICDELQCRFCTETFHASLFLQMHLDLNHPQHDHQRDNKQCPQCGKMFSTSCNMLQHQKRKHSLVRKYVCKLCDKSFAVKYGYKAHCNTKVHKLNALKQAEEDTERQLHEQDSEKEVEEEPDDLDDDCLENSQPTVKKRRGRKKKHHSAPYTCDTCGYKYLTQTRLDQHLLTRYHMHTLTEAATATLCIACGTCGHKFYSQDRYRLHELVHGEQTMAKGPGQNYKFANRVKGVPEEYHDFVRKLPKEVSSEVQCPACKDWFKVNTVIPHIRSKHSNGLVLPYQCTFCPRSFPSNSSLYRHHKSHLGLKSFPCEICSKGFRSKSDLDSHELSAHQAELKIEPRVQCDICGAGFMLQARLNLHMKEKHNRVRKYWCEWPGCNRSFCHNQEYLIHTRGHTGEKPYLCILCGFSTKTKVQLTRHERIHTDVTDFKCKHCPYSSRNSAGLRRHKRLHTGAKPYKCPHCEHRCYSHTNIRAHVGNSRVHPGLLLYNCRHCVFATNVTTDFQKHMFESHAVRPEDVANVALYCGVYIPEDDVTEVTEGIEPLPVSRRRPRRDSTTKPKKPAKVQKPAVVSAQAGLTETMIIVRRDLRDHAVLVKRDPQDPSTYILESPDLITDATLQQQIVEHVRRMERAQLAESQGAASSPEHNTTQYKFIQGGADLDEEEDESSEAAMEQQVLMSYDENETMVTEEESQQHITQISTRPSEQVLHFSEQQSFSIGQPTAYLEEHSLQEHSLQGEQVLQLPGGQTIHLPQQMQQTVSQPKAETAESIAAAGEEQESICPVEGNDLQHTVYALPENQADNIYVKEVQQMVAPPQNEQIVAQTEHEEHVVLQPEYYEEIQNTIKHEESEATTQETVKADQSQTIQQVYMASDGTELSQLIQGLEETGAVVELHMEHEYNIPDGKPGQVIQMMGDDNKPIQYYYV